MLETRHDFTEISIHSLHTEGDPLSWFKYCRRGDFNPLPPHGGRPGQSSREPLSCIFQSTPSTRRETDRPTVAFSLIRYFNPLPPHGGRPQSPTMTTTPATFQSTPSTRRETVNTESDSIDTTFQSTPSTRRETGQALQKMISTTFQSTPSTRRET